VAVTATRIPQENERAPVRPDAAAWLVADINGRPSAAWWLAAFALALTLAAPFLAVDVPPVLDYPNHLARYFVLAHPDDPILSRMYAPHWTILPNLGMDLIGVALVRLLDVHVAGRLLLALSLFAPIVGVIVYSRAAFGRFSFWPLSAGLVAYNGIFFLGFMNFSLALGLALIAAAVHAMLRRRGHLPAACFGMAASTVLFFCHLFGVVLFAALIGAAEADRLWRLWRTKPADVFSAALCAAAGLGLAIVPALALYAMCPFAEGAATFANWRGIAKAWTLLTPFMVYGKWLTALTAVAVFSFFVLFRRQLAFAPGILLTLGVLAACFVVTPSAIKNGTFVDARVALMGGLVLFAGTLPRLTSRDSVRVAAVIVALIALRSIHVGAAWFDHRHDLADLRAAIAKVEPGTRVLVARGHPGHLTEVQPTERALPGMYRMDGHLAALLLIERRAFWPLLFADPTQQPVIVRPPYAAIAHPLGEPIDWPRLADGNADAVPAYAAHWRDKFDALLLIDPPSPLQAPSGLQPVHAGDFAVLYRITATSKPAPPG
jgi:hypothetical protein